MPVSSPQRTSFVRFSAVRAEARRLQADPAANEPLAYLDSRGVAYREHDIDTADGQLAFAQAGSASGVPLLLVGEQRVQGFSASAYDALFRQGGLAPKAR